MASRAADSVAMIGKGLGTAEVKAAPSQVLDEKTIKELETNINAQVVGEDVHLKTKSEALVGVDEDGAASDSDGNTDGAIIVTGADAAQHLLPLRDDKDSSITFRGMVLATALSAFQAVMSQIYYFKPTTVTIQGTFIVLIAYFLGKAWTAALPRGDRAEAHWRAKGNPGPVTAWIKFLKFINPGPWQLKEHAVCAITATSASNAIAASQVFSAQNLFYDIPLLPTTVILSTISIGLFGYGLCGIFRPITVWHVEAVYWTNIPTVKTLQGLHWQDIRNSKPIRYFWYAFCSMFAYEFLPAYIWPWLNSISIPCLASMNATGQTAATLTNLFGGATNNEGLGLFSLSLDWQYTTSFQTSLPLKFQLHQAIGLFTCMIIMLALYYGNAWNGQSQPFMSTRLRTQDGASYPLAKVFQNGILNTAALEKYGLPALTATFAFSLFMANAAIGALIAHCIFFWGKDILKAYKSARAGKYEDRHHSHMQANYKEVPQWWYAIIILISFILGLVVVLTQDISLTAWAYVVSLLLGSIIAPFSAIIYSRFGNGIATNNLSKMLGGLILPGRPVGNMYFAAWSHNVILQTVNMSSDLKFGEYLKIPPRTMLVTQIWGTVFGGFINYAVMVSIVTSQRDLLTDSNGNSAWSGAQIQAYNTNATAWALAKYLYALGDLYAAIPFGILVGFGLVVLQRILIIWVPRIRGFSLSEINLPQFIQYAGYIPYNQSQTCVLLTWILSGLYIQFYLRNYKPRIFKDYSYLVTAAWDGAALTALFILSFAVFGAGSSPPVNFPQWWGNNVAGNYDLCPVPDS